MLLSATRIRELDGIAVVASATCYLDRWLLGASTTWPGSTRPRELTPPQPPDHEFDDQEGRMPIYYHGGVPGKRRRQTILPATKVKMNAVYNPDHVEKAIYYPDRVYLTTHLGAAMGYAARYIDRRARRSPGDVYQVEPIGTPEVDPDFAAQDGAFVMCREAVIIEVVERNVQLTLREQTRLAGPTILWPRGKPVYTDDGTLQLSDQMRAAGVRDDYVALLPKWIDLTEINSLGEIVSPRNFTKTATARDLLDIFSHLTWDNPTHQIRGAGHAFECVCGQRYDTTNSAAIHQAGEHLVVLQRHNIAARSRDLIDLLAERRPQRWAWLTHTK
ncbi:hypothetical protein AB0C34_17010 [Nocardia sp. NPDC049220]|uniref:hypothetical protein n=1 Tax=Nocardia sp. NPDC049220 TaxID=3155273 RepID=UPI00340A12D7